MESEESMGRVRISEDMRDDFYISHVIKQYTQVCSSIIEMIPKLYPPVMVRKVWRGRTFCYLIH